MSLDQQRVKALFFDALELPQDEVDAFLDQVEADEPQVAAEVRSLLGHHDGRSLILGTGPLREAVQAPAPTAPGERYQVLGTLGEGGFGTVLRC